VLLDTAHKLRSVVVLTLSGRSTEPVTQKCQYFSTRFGHHHKTLFQTRTATNYVTFIHSQWLTSTWLLLAVCVTNRAQLLLHCKKVQSLLVPWWHTGLRMGGRGGEEQLRAFLKSPATIDGVCVVSLIPGCFTAEERAPRTHRQERCVGPTAGPNFWQLVSINDDRI
jgi:hypothetical protein